MSNIFYYDCFQESAKTGMMFLLAWYWSVCEIKLSTYGLVPVINILGGMQGEYSTTFLCLALVITIMGAFQNAHKFMHKNLCF